MYMYICIYIHTYTYITYIIHIHTYIFNMRTLTLTLTWLCTERLRCSARERSVGASTEAMSVLFIALLQHAVIDAVAAPQLQRLSCSMHLSMQLQRLYRSNECPTHLATFRIYFRI
jgi:hypothetical protein